MRIYLYRHRLMTWGRIAPALGLVAALATASLAYAESKNDAKKSYDAVITKASRDLTDGKIDDATKDAQQADKLDPNNPETGRTRIPVRPEPGQAKRCIFRIRPVRRSAPLGDREDAIPPGFIKRCSYK